MTKSILSAAFLSTLLFASVAVAGEVTAKCSGTVIVTIGLDGPDKMTAVDAKFTLKMKDDKTATLLLENEFAKPIKGVGKESGNADAPWTFEAKDEDGTVFKGQMKAVEGTYPGDKKMYIILDLKAEKLAISGPMSCTMQ